MDEQFRDGFDRMLSDVPDGPSWQDVGSGVPQPTGKRFRSRGPLVALAAFLITIVAVGGGLLALIGRSKQTTPAAATVDHIELSWAQDVVLRCVDMEKTDNEGFGVAKIDIWGPNSDGLVRIDATAPDGTVERIVATYPRGRSAGQQVWSSQAFGSNETAFRVAGCSTGTANGSSHYSMSDPPVSPTGHVFGRFISIPVVRGDGEPWDLENDPFLGEHSSDEVWNGTPVEVFMRADTGVDDLGTYGSRSETWVDVVNRHYEVQRILADHDVLGTVVTAIEVRARDTVPTDSVSFSTENMNLTLDIPPIDPSSEAEPVTTTSASDSIDSVARSLDPVEIEAEITRRQTLIDDARQQSTTAEDAVRQNRATLDALQAQTDPPAPQPEIDRQQAVVRMSELQAEYLDRIIQVYEAEIAALQVRYASSVALMSGTDEQSWTERDVSDAASTWANNLGLVQLDDRVWRVRLGAVCSDGANLEHLAAAYIQEDADVSQRSDGSLPTPTEAEQTLEMIAPSPTCRP